MQCKRIKSPKQSICFPASNSQNSTRSNLKASALDCAERATTSGLCLASWQTVASRSPQCKCSRGRHVKKIGHPENRSSRNHRPRLYRPASLVPPPEVAWTRSPQRSPRPAQPKKGRTMNLEPILQRLDRVRRVKTGIYKACCPAHDDSSPSLEIKDAGDKALLICRAGCTFDEIRSALGMDSSEFFADGKVPRQAAPGVSLRDLSEAISLELAVCYVCACDRAKGRQLQPRDLARERQARDRILSAWRAAS